MLAEMYTVRLRQLIQSKTVFMLTSGKEMTMKDEPPKKGNRNTSLLTETASRPFLHRIGQPPLAKGGLPRLGRPTEEGCIAFVSKAPVALRRRSLAQNGLAPSLQYMIAGPARRQFKSGIHHHIIHIILLDCA
jgi:hypothetical protein